MHLHAALLSQLSAADREAYGGKAANLGEMARLGLPVPQGFALPVEACRQSWGAWDAGGAHGLSREIRGEIDRSLSRLEQETARRLGGEPPLVLSVRSGAPISMPGMMDTILNVGLDEVAAEHLARAGGQVFASDCQARLASTFQSAAGSAPPARARDQLYAAVEAVFRSWRTPRAIDYRRDKGIGEDLGTAVVVQRMVFGNLDRKSGTGVAFSRHPSTGERRLTGEFALMCQGEDVVAGELTPRPLAAMKQVLPDAFGELNRAAETLERHFHAVQDIEFTVESEVFYLLQTRNAKLAARAALVTALDLYDEGQIGPEEALSRLSPEGVRAVLLPGLAPEELTLALCQGLPACPGVASGVAVFTAERAIEESEQNDIILVRPETTPADLGGMLVAAGVVTARGGSSSHAAVVARDLGLPCVVGCEAMDVDARAGTAQVGAITIREGDQLTVDGSHGLLFLGRRQPLRLDPPPQLAALRKLASVQVEGGGAFAPHALKLLEALGC